MLVEKFNIRTKFSQHQQMLFLRWQALPEREKNIYNYSFAKYIKHMERK